MTTSLFSASGKSQDNDPGAGPAAPVTAAARVRGAVTVVMTRYVVVPILIGLIIYTEINDHLFLTWSSIKVVLSDNASIGLIAVGLTPVLLAGGFDISVGSVYAGGASVYTTMGMHEPLVLALVIAIVAGIVAGAVNGILTTVFNLNAFVATLGTASLFAGLTLAYAGTVAVTPSNPSFPSLGNGAVAGVPYTVVILVAALILGALLVHRTPFGKSLYAIGGSPGASRLVGLPIARYRFITYLISGGCAALAGAIYASQTGVSTTDLGGLYTALTALAMIVLGGTSLYGGEGSMWRTAIGVLVLAVITNLFNTFSISEAVQEWVEGLIVLAALGLDSVIRGQARQGG